ncbi:MAG: hypothetical protein FJ146_03645 [Deltaproteobacteria bacterium]|nr:hypothetical protein [Deltaproteobacteria bacterium]
MKRIILNFSLLAFLLVTVFIQSARAATINAVSASKSMISLTVSPDESFNAKDRICVLSPKKKKLACGVVVKVKGGTKIIVKVTNKNELAKLKKGSKANLELMTGKDAGGGESESSSPDTSSGKKAPFRVAVGWASAIMLPASYNQLSYLPPEGETPTTIWKSESVLSSGILPPSYIGFAGEIGIPIGTKALSIGGKFQVFQSTIFSSNYEVELTDPYVSTQTSGSAFGAWADFTFLRKNVSQKLAFNAYSGLGFDLYSVSVKSKKLTDTAPSQQLAELSLADATIEGTPIITGSGKLGLISLRAGARVDFQIVKHVGLSLGSTAIIPLVAPMNSVSVEVVDGEDRGIADPQADFQQGLGLTKKSFALDILIGAFASF